MTHNKGFTLIELIILIVLLAIFSAVVAPRFISFPKEAKIASLEAMQGAMKSGADLIYSKAIVESKTVGSDSITIGDATISLHSGYPVGNWMVGFRYIVNLDAVYYSKASVKCTTDWCGMGNQRRIPSGVSTTSPGRIGKVFFKGYSFNDQCGVYYLNHEDGRKPEIGIETADC